MTTKDVSSKNLAYMSYVLTQLPRFERNRKNRNETPIYSLQVNQLWHDVIANLPTDCIWWTWLASALLKIAGAS